MSRLEKAGINRANVGEAVIMLSPNAVKSPATEARRGEQKRKAFRRSIAAIGETGALTGPPIPWRSRP
jgi:hypothetical protein